MGGALANESGTTSSLIGLKGIDIVVDEATEGNLTWALIKIFYNQSELDALNILESSLKIYFYNATAGDWQLEPNQGVNTADDYIWANVTHLSLFGVFGSSETSGGGSSGGGGGGAPGTTFSTIADAGSLDALTGSLSWVFGKGQQITFGFDGNNHAIGISVLTSTAATVIFDTGARYVLGIGQAISTDLNTDGKSDITLVLDNIVNGKAYFSVFRNAPALTNQVTVDAIAEDSTQPPVSEKPTIPQEIVQDKSQLPVPESESTGSDNMLYAVLVISLIMIVGVAFVVLRKGKNRHSGYY